MYPSPLSSAHCTDASIYIYHRTSGKLLERLSGHGEGTVNAVAWHPKLPSLLASCSDDGTVRIWQPEQALTDKNKRRSGRLSVRDSWGRGNMDLMSNLNMAAKPSTSEGKEAASAAGLLPFPWSMSPARPSSPDTDGEGTSGNGSQLPMRF